MNSCRILPHDDGIFHGGGAHGDALLHGHACHDVCVHDRGDNVFHTSPNPYRIKQIPNWRTKMRKKSVKRTGNWPMKIARSIRRQEKMLKIAISRLFALLENLDFKIFMRVESYKRN